MKTLPKRTLNFGKCSNSFIESLLLFSFPKSRVQKGNGIS